MPEVRSKVGGGWVLTTRPWSEGKLIMHDGSNTTWFAYVWISPEEDFAVLVSFNQGGTAGQRATDAAAGRLLLGMAQQRASEARDED